jgi:hypothetical protein
MENVGRPPSPRNLHSAVSILHSHFGCLNRLSSIGPFSFTSLNF